MCACYDTLMSAKTGFLCLSTGDSIAQVIFEASPRLDMLGEIRKHHTFS